jgi:hypothetical protein
MPNGPWFSTFDIFLSLPNISKNIYDNKNPSFSQTCLPLHLQNSHSHLHILFLNINISNQNMTIFWSCWCEIWFFERVKGLLSCNIEGRYFVLKYEGRYWGCICENGGWFSRKK